MLISNTRTFKLQAHVATVLLVIFAGSGIFAQGTPIFAPGNLVVTRSTYTGTAGTVPFPGSLPNNAASVANGTFPNVFNNETPDASFGVTSPIVVDTFTTTGSSISLVNTANVTNLISSQLGQNVATSFPSKSEVGLNFTADGTAITFMAYGAAANQLDVSNANTPGHVDITNPVNGQSVLINQRDVVELSYNGNVQVTTTNTYSGNNGRNVVLGSNGNYYIVGNAGNNGKSVNFSSGTVTLANGSTTVTLSGSSSTANMYIGTPFSGTNVPAHTYVTAISSPTQFTISAAATGTASGSYTANEGGYQLTGVSFSTGNTNITVADTSKLVPGMTLSGSGFASNSYIQSVSDTAHFVASAAPTGNSSSGGNYVASVSNSMLSDNTGVQMIQKGSNDTTGTGSGILDAINHSTVVGKVNGTYGTTPGYQRGFSVAQTNPLTGSPYAAADKTGKDDNFRGLTNYNNAIYVTKGSGSNGLDGVYQVNPSGGAYVPPGSSAGLPTIANAGTSSVNLLPGWPADSLGANEGVAGHTVYHPFGIWFASDTTLYVADEGLAGSSGSNAAPGGLEKWTWNSTTSQWELKYTIAASTIPAYAVNGLNLQAEGLRNIAGVNNGDGTVTIYAITSTTGQTLNDEGADPNQLVSITDNLSATILPVESFNVLETAAYGDVLRGVASVQGAILQSVVSRMTHGSAGTFNLPLSTTSRVVEPRSNGTGNYTIVFNFDRPVNSGNASVTGTGSVGSVTFSGNSMIVGLTGVTDQQTATVSVSNVLGSSNQTPDSASVQVGFLYCDVSGDGAVNAGDTIIVRNNAGATLNNTNFQDDVNADGSINVGDTIAVRNNSGHMLSPQPAPAKQPARYPLRKAGQPELK